LQQPVIRGQEPALLLLSQRHKEAIVKASAGRGGKRQGPGDIWTKGKEHRRRAHNVGVVQSGSARWNDLLALRFDETVGRFADERLRSDQFVDLVLKIGAETHRLRQERA